MRKPTEQSLTRAAMSYLDRYASSRENLQRVLERKVQRYSRELDFDPAIYEPVIQTILERCEKSGLIDDHRYAETKLASLRRKGASDRSIQAKLGAQGIDRAIIDAALGNDETSDHDAARRYAQRRRFGPWRTSLRTQTASDDQLKDIETREIAAMCRAGHSYEIARRVIQEKTENDDDC